MTNQTIEQLNDPDTAVVVVELDKWNEHVKKVEFLTGTLAALLNSLGQHPAFAGFIPADIREQLAKLV